MTINDRQLRHDVEAELDWDTRVDSQQIGVAVKNGVVALSGYVGSYAEKRAAEEAVQSVAGVRAIANDIVIELPPAAQRSDAELAESAVSCLPGIRGVSNAVVINSQTSIDDVKRSIEDALRRRAQLDAKFGSTVVAVVGIDTLRPGADRPRIRIHTRTVRIDTNPQAHLPVAQCRCTITEGRS